MTISTTHRIALTLLVGTMAIPQAQAAMSEWTDAEGGRVRIVVDTSAAPATELRGIIQIDLKPGWKTYWREPGSAGVPPQIDISQSSNIEQASLAFPAPYRFDKGPSAWAGYKKSVSLPVTFTLTDKGTATHLRGHVFLGICETICIPVQAAVDIPIAAGQPDLLAHTLVNAAFDRLPAAARSDFGANKAAREGEFVRLTVALPDADAEPDLFVASDGLSLGMAKLEQHSGHEAVFLAPLLSGKDKQNLHLHYTLTQKGQAVSGEIVAP